jgi:hypothetical protein
MQGSSNEANDHDYWNHSNPGFGQSRYRNCRITHGSSTWYFSFMGRKERQLKKLAEQKAEREERDLAFFTRHR